MAGGVKLPDMVEVVWRDSFTTSGWRTLEEYDAITAQSADIHTVGFLLRRRPNVVIAQSFQPEGNDDERVSEAISIPRALVSRITLLRKGKESKVRRYADSFSVPGRPIVRFNAGEAQPVERGG